MRRRRRIRRSRVRGRKTKTRKKKGARTREQTAAPLVIAPDLSSYYSSVGPIFLLVGASVLIIIMCLEYLSSTIMRIATIII